MCCLHHTHLFYMKCVEPKVHSGKPLSSNLKVKSTQYIPQHKSFPTVCDAGLFLWCPPWICVVSRLIICTLCAVNAHSNMWVCWAVTFKHLSCDRSSVEWFLFIYTQIRPESCGSSPPESPTQSLTIPNSLYSWCNTSGLSAITIALGWYHTCVIVAWGEIKCWGLNDRGQLGIWNTYYSSLNVPGVARREAIQAMIELMYGQRLW